jgi:hypothetical protein
MATIEEQVNRIIDNALTLSRESVTFQKQQADKATEAAQQLIAPSDPGNLLSNDMVDVEAPSNPSLAEVLEKNNVLRANQILNKLKAEYDAIVAKFYPFATVTAAADWISDVLNGTKTTGIPAATEDAIWNRARDREQAVANAAINNISEDHARLGWAAPPGSLIHQRKQVIDERDRKLCEINRELAISQARLEQENIQFAVGQATSLQNGVLNAASQFITALLGAYASANDYGGQLSDATKTFYDQSIQYYTAFLAAEEFKITHRKTDIDIDLVLQQLVIDIFKQRSTEMTNAALSAAKTSGDTAAAALSSQTTFGGLSVEETK